MAIIGDFVLLWVFFVVGYIQFRGPGAWSDLYVLFYAYMTLTWLILGVVFGNFRMGVDSSIFDLWATYTKQVVFFFFAFLMFFQLKSFGYYPREWLRYIFPGFYICLLVWQFALRFAYLIYRNKAGNKKNTLLIGNSAQVLELSDFLKHNPWHGYHLIDTLSASGAPPSALGRLHQLPELIEKYKIEEIFIATEDLKDLDKMQLFKVLNKHPLKINLIPILDNFIFERIELQEYGNVPILRIHTGPLSFWYNRWMKRTFDLILSVMVIVMILSWMTLILFIVDLLGKKQGVFFTQKRTSIYGKTFTIIKYRSMIINEDADKRQATSKDHRITPLGHFLRRTSLDELPQFINVFMGHMSVVGPRPHMLVHTERYSEIVKSFMIRHTVKPGLTGLAQVSGYRGEVKEISDIQKRVEKDIYYIRNWSMNMDIWIVLKTVWFVIKPS